MNVDLDILLCRSAAEVAEAIKRPSYAELAREIPLNQLRAMTPEKRDILAGKLHFCRAFNALARLNKRRHGNKGQLDPILTREAARLAGLERVSIWQSEKWRRDYERGGAVTLIDNRGRPAGPVAFDADFVVALGERLARGESLTAAHRAIRLERAARGERTPCVETLRKRFAEGIAFVEIPEKKPAKGRLSYLAKGCSLQ
jgi:hypothetical protein